jgi:hypothetical protein
VGDLEKLLFFLFTMRFGEVFILDPAFATRYLSHRLAGRNWRLSAIFFFLFWLFYNQYLRNESVNFF